jgi:hypothetical protein
MIRLCFHPTPNLGLTSKLALVTGSTATVLSPGLARPAKLSPRTTAQTRRTPPPRMLRNPRDALRASRSGPKAPRVNLSILASVQTAAIYQETPK